ncbi:MAG: alpha/beta fold hydrolase [Gammaproteobacteria bacterium]|nr:alpha/beta fold hydrolase [Gammaproteobacteria bacterium]
MTSDACDAADVTGTLLYLHGFLSSPLSAKAVQTGAALASRYPGMSFECPALSPYPREVEATIRAIANRGGPLVFMGSSLGGFWATWCAEVFGGRAVLINPATQPALLELAYVGKTLGNYHTEQTYRLTRDHVRELLGFERPRIMCPENLLVLLQTGDEVLDYRLALAKYHGARVITESGGDHSFTGFERYLDEALDFLAAGAGHAAAARGTNECA